MPDKDAEFLPHGEDNEERELNTLEARQAVTLGRMRYVLAIGLFLVVVLFAIIYFATIGQVSRESPASTPPAGQVARHMQLDW